MQWEQRLCCVCVCVCVCVCNVQLPSQVYAYLLYIRIYLYTQYKGVSILLSTYVSNIKEGIYVELVHELSTTNLSRLYRHYNPLTTHHVFCVSVVYQYHYFHIFSVYIIISIIISILWSISICKRYRVDLGGRDRIRLQHCRYCLVNSMPTMSGMDACFDQS